MGMKLITEATGAALATVFGLAAALWKKGKRRGAVTVNGITLLFKGETVLHITSWFWVAYNNLTGKLYDMSASLGFTERSTYFAAHTGGVYTETRHVATTGTRFITLPGGGLSGRNYVDLEGNRTGGLEWVPDGRTILKYEGALVIPQRKQTAGVVVASASTFVNSPASTLDTRPEDSATLVVRGAANGNQVQWQHTLDIGQLTSTYARYIPCDGALSVVGYQIVTSTIEDTQTGLPFENMWHVSASGLLSEFSSSATYAHTEAVYVAADRPGQPPYRGAAFNNTVAGVKNVLNTHRYVAGADKGVARVHVYTAGVGTLYIETDTALTDYTAWYENLGGRQTLQYTENYATPKPFDIPLIATLDWAYGGLSGRGTYTLETVSTCVPFSTSAWPVLTQPPVYIHPALNPAVAGLTFGGFIYVRSIVGYDLDGRPQALVVTRQAQITERNFYITYLGGAAYLHHTHKLKTVYKYWIITPSAATYVGSNEIDRGARTDTFASDHTPGVQRFRASFLGRGPRGEEYMVFTEDGAFPVSSRGIGEALTTADEISHNYAECVGGALLATTGGQYVHYSFSNGSTTATGAFGGRVYTTSRYALFVFFALTGDGAAQPWKVRILDLQTRVLRETQLTVSPVKATWDMMLLPYHSYVTALTETKAVVCVSAASIYVMSMYSVDLSTGEVLQTKHNTPTDPHARTAPVAAPSAGNRDITWPAFADSYLLP